MSANAGPSNRPTLPLPTRRMAGPAPAARPLHRRRSRGAISAGSSSSVRPTIPRDLLEDDDFDLPSLLAGSYASNNADDGNETDDDVKVLEQAPERLRKVTNKDNPHTIDDSDGEAGPAPKATVGSPAAGGKRKRDDVPTAVDDDGWEIFDGLFSEVVEDENEGPAPKRARVESKSAADFLADVLDIIPDLNAETALATLQTELDAGRTNECVERTIGSMLEMVGGYPKAKVSKGKEKEADSHPDLYRDENYRRIERLGPGYDRMSLEELEKRFVRVSAKEIRAQFVGQQRLFVPTYFALQDQLRLDNPPFALLKRSRAYDKGKSRVADNEDEHPFGSDRGSSEFRLEVAFLDSYMTKARIEADELAEQKLAREEALANGEGVECGCCFGEETWDAIFQCSEGHLFCRECVKMHAETKLGEQKTRIDCMDGSGCPALFPESELRRLLSDKSLHLYHRLKQNAELAEAGIDGLETCPGCDYAAVIDNPEEKLFRCMNQSCMRVSCRKCHKPNHIPKTCEEAESDKKLDKRHAVEEAMTGALLRKCPNCEQPYIKEDGCNKIMCSKCHTLSCYVCQKRITGYDHFDQGPGGRPTPGGRGKCLLHDQDEAAKDHQTVIAARDAAQQDVREAAQQQGLELGDADIDVAAPDQPRPGAADRFGVAVPYPPRVYAPGAGPGQPFVAGYRQPGVILVGAAGMPGHLVGAGGLQDAGQRIRDLAAQARQQFQFDAARVQDAVAQYHVAAQAQNAPGNPHLAPARDMMDILARQQRRNMIFGEPRVQSPPPYMAGRGA